MRKPYIAANWKMNLTAAEASNFAKRLRDEIEKNPPSCRVTVAPSFVYLTKVNDEAKGSFSVASQNIADKKNGAYTGEVSPLMLKDIGINIAIIGHSERRQYYGETDESVNRKVLLALEEGMEVILCVGETLEERENGLLEAVLERQITKAFSAVKEIGKITVAYEPVWAIGTGKTATPEDAENAHAFIRKTVASLYSFEIANNLIIQYGGSVKKENIKDLIRKENVDGALVGGASLKIEDFLPIVYYDR